MEKIYYRYEDYGTVSIDEFDNCHFAGQRIRELEFKLLKKTAKGAWLDIGFGDRRFMLDGSRKKFACPTKQEAIESFIARKNKQISIYKTRIDRAQSALHEIERYR